MQVQSWFFIVFLWTSLYCQFRDMIKNFQSFPDCSVFFAHVFFLIRVAVHTPSGGSVLTSGGIVFRRGKIIRYSLYVIAAFSRHCIEFPSKWLWIEDVWKLWNFGRYFLEVRGTQAWMVLCTFTTVFCLSLYWWKWCQKNTYEEA